MAIGFTVDLQDFQRSLLPACSYILKIISVKRAKALYNSIIVCSIASGSQHTYLVHCLYKHATLAT